MFSSLLCAVLRPRPDSSIGALGFILEGPAVVLFWLISLSLSEESLKVMGKPTPDAPYLLDHGPRT